MAHFQAITPDDANDLPKACCDFYVATPGDLNVVAQGDDVTAAVVLTVTAGVLRLPWPLRRIMQTSTTAGGIVGLGF